MPELLEPSRVGRGVLDGVLDVPVAEVIRRLRRREGHAGTSGATGNGRGLRRGCLWWLPSVFHFPAGEVLAVAGDIRPRAVFLTFPPVHHFVCRVSVRVRQQFTDSGRLNLQNRVASFSRF